MSKQIWGEGFAKMNFPSLPFKIPPASPVLTLQLCPQLAVPQWGLVGVDREGIQRRDSLAIAVSLLLNTAGESLKSPHQSSQVGKRQARSVECLVGRDGRHLGHLFWGILDCGMVREERKQGSACQGLWMPCYTLS